MSWSKVQMNRVPPMLRKGVALGAFLAVLGSVAIASGAIPGADGVIDGCYTKSTGALRVIDTEGSIPVTCKTSEAALSWNQTGPAGPPGPKGDPCLSSDPACVGPAGPPGPPGPQGEPGASSADEVVFKSHTGFFSALPSDGTPLTVLTARIPAGSYVIEARATVEMVDEDPSSFPLHVICTLPFSSAMVEGTDRQGAPFPPGWRGTDQLEITTALNQTTTEFVQLRCKTGRFTETSFAAVSDITLLATKVAKVTDG